VEVRTVPLRAVRVSVACRIVCSADDIVGVAHGVGYSHHVSATCYPLVPSIIIVGIDNVSMPGQCKSIGAVRCPAIMDCLIIVHQLFGAQWRQRHFVVFKFAIDFLVG
jgi:hypothetical protein